MPITSKATMPLCRPREPSFIPKLNYRFDIPAGHLVIFMKCDPSGNKCVFVHAHTKAKTKLFQNFN